MAASFHKAARGTQHTRRQEGMKKMKGSGEMRARRGGWEEGKFRVDLPPSPSTRLWAPRLVLSFPEPA